MNWTTHCSQNDRICRKIVAVVIDVTQFGVAVVYLLLSSKNIRDFLQAFFDIDFSYCIVVLILALCLLPVTFLKSPQDFWFVPLHSISSELLKWRNFLSIAKMLRSAITPSVSIRKKHIFHSLLLPFLSRLRMIGGSASTEIFNRVPLIPSLSFLIWSWKTR